MKILHWLSTILVNWINKEVTPIRKFPLSDFNKLKYEVHPCDVLLIEGRKRISQIIKLITQTSWSHSTLYIGRLLDIEDMVMQKKVSAFYQGAPQDQLVIESLLGKGTIISSLTKYAKEHIRICRPESISHNDAQEVINYCIKHLGVQYDFRQIFDLARLLLPWPLLPRNLKFPKMIDHKISRTKTLKSRLKACLALSLFIDYNFFIFIIHFYFITTNKFSFD